MHHEDMTESEELEEAEVSPADTAQAEDVPVAAAAEADAEVDAEDDAGALRDQYLRLAADFDNFRKRVTRERMENRVRAQADLITGLLDALDDLARVAHPDHKQAAVKDVQAGVELVERKLLRQLDVAGLERIGDVNQPFDPEIHEAVAAAAAASPDDDNTVAAVLQVGYRFHGQLLRPARVQVRIWSQPEEDGGTA